MAPEQQEQELLAPPLAENKGLQEVNLNGGFKHITLILLKKHCHEKTRRSAVIKCTNGKRIESELTLGEIAGILTYFDHGAHRGQPFTHALRIMKLATLTRRPMRIYHGSQDIHPLGFWRTLCTPRAKHQF